MEHVPDWESAVEKLDGMMDTESLVLVKGSNGMNLLNLVHHFTEKQA